MRLVERELELTAIDALLATGGVLVVEGGAGLGKTSLLAEAGHRARARGRDVLTARGSPLEADFAFGVVRQLFERRLAHAPEGERDELLVGPAHVVTRVLWSGAAVSAFDTSFAVWHGLCWLAVNLADRHPLLIVVDDVHWADAPSARWLAHLAPRIEGEALAVVVAVRPGEPVTEAPWFEQVRASATVICPGRLSPDAVAELAQEALGAGASDDRCAMLYAASGGNPFYLAELLRSGGDGGDGRGPGSSATSQGGLGARRGDGITRHVRARLAHVDPTALAIAQALSILGDGGQLRHAARVAGLDMAMARRAAADLVRCEVLAGADPPRFLHPIVRDAVEATLDSDRREAMHRAAARLYFGEGAAGGQVAMHVMRCAPAEDPWAVRRLRAAARSAMEAGASRAAAQLLERALAEPPPPEQRVEILRDLARAELNAGRAEACASLERARALAGDARTRGEIALEMAEAHAGLFRWVEAVDVAAQALGELGELGEADAGAGHRPAVEVPGQRDGEDPGRHGGGVPQPAPRRRPLHLCVGRRLGATGARGRPGPERGRGAGHRRERRRQA